LKVRLTLNLPLEGMIDSSGDVLIKLGGKKCLIFTVFHILTLEGGKIKVGVKSVIFKNLINRRSLEVLV